MLREKPGLFPKCTLSAQNAKLIFMCLYFILQWNIICYASMKCKPYWYIRPIVGSCKLHGKARHKNQFDSALLCYVRGVKIGILYFSIFFL